MCIRDRDFTFQRGWMRTVNFDDFCKELFAHLSNVIQLEQHGTSDGADCGVTRVTNNDKILQRAFPNERPGKSFPVYKKYYGVGSTH